MIGNDTTGTSTNIPKFVDAYNEALKIVQQQLQTSETTDRAPPWPATRACGAFSGACRAC